MTIARIASASAVVLCLTLGTADRATAQQPDVDLKARAHFAAGEYQQAVAMYAQLYAETLHPTYLRNIGRCYQNMGEPDKAISAFREYLRKAENLDPKPRAEVEGFIREMEALKREREAAPHPAVAASPRLAPIAPSDRVDDSRKPGVDLKAEPIQAKAPGSAPVYTRWWFWTAAAVLAAGGVVAALALSSGSNTPDARTTFGTMATQPR